MTKFTYLDLKNPFEAGYMGEKITGVGLSLLDPSDDLVKGTIFRFISVAEFSADDVIGGLVWKDNQGKVLARLDGISITNAELETGLGIGTPNEGDNDLSYGFLVSLLDGPVTVTGGKRDDDDMEVGEGGKAVVKGKAGMTASTSGTRRMSPSTAARGSTRSNSATTSGPQNCWTCRTGRWSISEGDRNQPAWRRPQDR